MIEETHSASQQVQEGRWTKEEHERFLIGIMEHGKDWKIVEKVVKTRTGSQVRSHAQKFFLKLHQISKERKKCKNKSLIQPSQTELEILNRFSVAQITKETPSEIVSILEKDWQQVAQAFKDKKRELKAARKNSLRKNKTQQEAILPGKLQSQTSNDRVMMNSQESYFIKTIKMNKEHFSKGHQFVELMGFQQKASEPNHVDESVRERRISFCLLDEQDNENKLKETLESLHRKFGIAN